MNSLAEVKNRSTASNPPLILNESIPLNGNPSLPGSSKGPINFFVCGESICAHDDVRVAVDVFSEAVHDNVSPEEEGRGVEGGEEGVVDEEEGIGWVTVGYLSDAGYIDEAKGRVRG